MVKLRNDGDTTFIGSIAGVEYRIEPKEVKEVPDSALEFWIGTSETSKWYVRQLFGGKIPPLVRVDGRKKETKKE